MKNVSAILFVVILLVLVILPFSVRSSLEADHKTPTKFNENLILLYKLRIEEAENDLVFDKAVYELRKEDFEMYNLLANKNVESKKAKRDSFLFYQQARVNKEASEIALKEVKLLYELIKELIEQGKIKPQETILLLQERSRTRVR